MSSSPGRGRKAKLLDFGVARPAAWRATLTQTGTMVGTPAYMAPEQVAEARTSTPHDVFALGACFRVLTAPAFVADHMLAVIARILFEERRTWAACAPTSPGARSAGRGMLSKDSQTTVRATPRR